MQFDDRQDVNSVKGVLIFLVVLGHSVLATEFPNLKAFVYSFHVYAFLIIPALLTKRVATWKNLLDAATRYLVPYLVVVIVASVLYASLMDYSVRRWLWFLVRGIGTGNDSYLKATSGFFLFWFLPVIFVVNVLLQVFNRAGPLGRSGLVVAFVAAHLLLPALPWELKQKYPFGGTHIALYVMPVALLTRQMCRAMDFAFCRRARGLWFLGFVVFVAAMFAQNSGLSLAHLGCPSYKSPLKVITHDGVAVLAVLTLLGFSKELGRVPCVALAGRRSLYIYLFSQPALVGVTSLYRRWIGLDGGVDTVLCGVAAIVAGVSIGIAGASLIESLPTVRAFVFPRSYEELATTVKGMGRLTPWVS